MKFTMEMDFSDRKILAETLRQIADDLELFEKRTRSVIIGVNDKRIRKWKIDKLG